MRVVIAGGHGQIALRLERMLAGRGDQPVGIVRNPDHVADLDEAGAEAVVLDLERATAAQLAPVLAGADAVVFAAGAGPGSGAARKQTVDRDAAVLLADAAGLAGVRRYVLVSAMGADHRADDVSLDPVFRAYLRAKADADQEVRSRAGLDATILCPGRLTDEPGTGLVRLGEQVPPGPIPRDDVAAVLAAVLDRPGTAGRTLEVVTGNTAVAEALDAVV